MTEIQTLPSGAARQSYYVTAEDALYYARYFHPVPDGRGWSRALMEENLPGWTLNDFMHLLRRHRLFVSTGFYGLDWRRPEVVGVVIEGDTLIEDKGDLEHPAKEAARRRIAVGSTGPTMRHLAGDDSPVVVHVRVSAATPDEERLHEVARAAYLTSPVRPALVRNISGSLADPFDQPPSVTGASGPPVSADPTEFVGGYFVVTASHAPPVWGPLSESVRAYNADMAALLQHLRRRRGAIVLITLNVHDGGDPVEVFPGDELQLPERLRADSQGITSKVVSLRADTLLDPHRADTIAALVGLIGRSSRATSGRGGT